MTPRPRIAWLDVAAPSEDNLAVMRETPYSRYPVCRGSEQDVVGVLQIKSLMDAFAGRKLDLFRELSPPLFVPETARASGKGSRTAKTLAQALAATVASVALGGMASLVHAQQAPPASSQLPQGGVVTRGSANIITTTGTGTVVMNVNQSSQRAVIDWASFNVGSQAKVQFNQPSASAVVRRVV